MNQYYALLYREKYPDRVHIVRAEDVMRDPKKTLGEVCDRLGLERSDSLAKVSWNGNQLEQVYPWGTIRTPTPEANLATARELRVRSAKLAADFQIALAHSRHNDGKGQIVADAKGTYAKQPITAEFVGGALLSLREASQPYPVNLKLANGPTRVSLAGTVQNPLNFAGADMKLEFAGPDMSLLLPLTGIAIPKTPPYHIAGKLDYAAGVVKFWAPPAGLAAATSTATLKSIQRGSAPSSPQT